MSDPGSRPKIGWIIALVGMCVVPLGGLVWAAIGGSGGADEETSEDITAEAGEEAGADGAETTGSSPTAKKKRRSKRKKPKASARGARKVTHEAAACCAALREAGREEPDVTKRPTYLAAASACEAAPTEARARTQVRSIVEGSRLELPGACQEE